MKPEHIPNSTAYEGFLRSLALHDDWYSSEEASFKARQLLNQLNIMESPPSTIVTDSNTWFVIALDRGVLVEVAFPGCIIVSRLAALVLLIPYSYVFYAKCELRQIESAGFTWLPTEIVRLPSGINGRSWFQVLFGSKSEMGEPGWLYRVTGDAKL